MPIRRRKLISLSLAVIVFHTALWITLPTQLAFTITSLDSGRLVYAETVSVGDSFEIRFLHSVHRTPVEEQFRIMQDHSIMLEQVRYETYGVGNPSEPQPGEVFRMENGTLILEQMKRRFPEIQLRIGQKVANHELVLDGRRLPLSTCSAPGSRVLMKVKRVSLWMLWTL